LTAGNSYPVVGGGSGGTGAPATSALLNSPLTAAVDGTGSLSSIAVSLRVGSPVTVVTVSGTQVYGSSNDIWTQTKQCPGGGEPLGQSVVHHGKRGKPVGPALAVAGYTVDANSCSGLSLSGPVNYKLASLGQPNGFEVSRASQSISFGSTNPSPAAVGKPTQSLFITFR
jgi:hypothetical protein